MATPPNDAPTASSDEVPAPATSLIPRWLASLVLALILAAAGVSCWLVVNADLERAEPPIPAPAGR